MRQALSSLGFVMGGWEGRTIYFMKACGHPEQWTQEKARTDITALLQSGAASWGQIIASRLDTLDESVRPGGEDHAAYEHVVRVTWNYLFYGQLSEGDPQSRSEPANEGVEIRDLMFHNRADKGFWNDLKQRYSCLEILLEVKNTSSVTREHLRQIYCYLKPAIGLWAFLVARSDDPIPDVVQACNRTLLKNFTQSRGLMILTDRDLRKMVTMKLRRVDPTDHLRSRFSEFLRSI